MKVLRREGHPAVENYSNEIRNPALKTLSACIVVLLANVREDKTLAADVDAKK
jgi:hypothetical protein